MALGNGGETWKQIDYLLSFRIRSKPTPSALPPTAEADCDNTGIMCVTGPVLVVMGVGELVSDERLTAALVSAWRQKHGSGETLSRPKLFWSGNTNHTGCQMFLTRSLT